VTRVRAVLAVALAATFAQLLDLSTMQVAVPDLLQDLHASNGVGRLVTAGYTLSYACTLITGARLGDRFGYRRLFVAGTALFVLGGAAGAVAWSGTSLIAVRCLQGLGSGLLTPQVFSFLQLVPRVDRRRQALALFGATMGAASLLGPLLGGLLLSVDPLGLGWRLLPLLGSVPALAALGGSRLLPAITSVGTAAFDAAGAALTAVGLGLLVLPLAIGADRGWPIWIWICLAVGATILAQSAARQRSRTLLTRPTLLDPGLLGDRAARGGVAMVALFNAGVPSLSYLLLLYLQTSLALSPLKAAVVVLPFAAAAIVGARAAPALAKWAGDALPGRAALVLGASTGLLAGLTAFGIIRTQPLWMMPALALAGLGFGVFTASAFAFVLGLAAPAAVGSASGLLPTAQQLGGSIGVPLAGLAYDLRGGFTSALLYETAVFLGAALLARRLRLNGKPDRNSGASVNLAGSGPTCR
jgi:MFS family permease